MFGEEHVPGVRGVPKPRSPIRNIRDVGLPFSRSEQRCSFLRPHEDHSLNVRVTLCLDYDTKSLHLD